MSPAAALLRRLDAEATGRPWRSSVYLNAVLDANENPIAYVGNADTRHAITTTRNLLPQLAGLVEAVGDAVSSLDRHVGSMAGQFADVDMAVDALRLRLAALEAAAAKEGAK